MCLQKLELTAAVQHMCTNHNKVGKYFEPQESLLQKTGLGHKLKEVWNMGEIVVQLDTYLVVFSQGTAVNFSMLGPADQW